jgi:galactokinase
MMDHFTSAIGGMIYMQTAPEFKPRSILNYQKNFQKSFILIDSMQKKNTVEDLRRVKSSALESMAKLKALFPNFDKYKTSIQEIKPYISKINESLQKVLLGNLANRDLTQNALNILEKSEHKKLTDNEKKEFGQLIYQHHQHLSKEVGISTPKIDSLVELCMENGAYGSKINGSGFGGTLFVYCPKNQEEIINILKAKSITYYPIEISQGAGVY